MATSKKPSAAQLAARKKFSDTMKAGGFAKKRAAKKTVSKKRVAKKNPIVLISDTPKKAARKTVRKANPVKKMVVSKKHAILPYCVEYKETEAGKWEAHSRFKYKEDAKESAYSLAEEYPEFIIRVMNYTGR